MNEESDFLLEEQDKPRNQIKVTLKTRSTLCKIWKFLLPLVFLMVICIWIMFTLLPPRNFEKLLRTRVSETRKTSRSSLYAKNCSLLPQTNVTSKWSGFKEVVPGTIMYSAFYDDTDPNDPFVRIIAISETFRPPKLFCHSRCDLDVTEEAEFHLVYEHKGRRHAAFIVSCSFPRGLGRDPGFIDLTAEYYGKKTAMMRYPVKSTKDAQTVHNYTICVPPLFGDLSQTNFIEFIELNRILGATHFVFYDLELKQDLRDALGFYQGQGTLTLLPWNLPTYVRDFYSIHYHAQLVAIHDCLYRNRGRSKWVGFHDLDEFIVPLTYPTIPFLLEEVNMSPSCGFCIQSTVLPLNNDEDKVQTANNSLVTQQVFLRTKTTFRTSREKCIVDPRKVYEMAIHFIMKPTSVQYDKSQISPKKALVFHYRLCIQYQDLIDACKNLVQENFMKKYKTRIRSRVDHVIRSLNT